MTMDKQTLDAYRCRLAEARAVRDAWEDAYDRTEAMLKLAQDSIVVGDPLDELQELEQRARRASRQYQAAQDRVSILLLERDNEHHTQELRRGRHG